jgi:4-hydroxybenzoate polyprenyltransferase
LKVADVDLLFKTFIAFIAFSLVASSVYVFNDYHDVREDLNHPKKRSRPLAAGRVSKRSAIFLLVFLLLAGLGVSFLLSLSISLLISFYFILNLAYTLKLKHIPIVDLFIISIGFMIRLAVGSQSGDIPLSMWIIIMTFLLALFLGLAKRRDDVLIYLESGEKVREVVNGYNIDFINTSMMIMASVVIVSYIMYTVSPEVMDRMHSDKLYVTTVFVIFGLMRYMQIAFVQKKSGSPTEVLVKDKFIQLSILGWIGTFVALIYR